MTFYSIVRMNTLLVYVSFILPNIPRTGSWSLYSPIFPILGRRVYTPRYSPYWVMEFILPDIPHTGSWSLYSPIFPILGHGVYTPDIPHTGSWSLYSRYSPYGVVEFILPIFPVRGCGVCSLLTRGSWLELRNKFRLDALPVTTIDCSGI